MTSDSVEMPGKSGVFRRGGVFAEGIFRSQYRGEMRKELPVAWLTNRVKLLFPCFPS